MDIKIIPHSLSLVNYIVDIFLAFVDKMCYHNPEVITMASFQHRFSELLSRSALNDSAVAEALGVSKQTVSAWKSGDRTPKRPTVITIASYFNVSVPWLLGVSDDDQAGFTRPLPASLRPVQSLHRQRVPLIGRVAAGKPIMAETDYESYVDTPVECDCALEVEGDSMVPTYLPGDILYIRHQPDVADGQIAVVLIDDRAAIKHVYHDPDGLTLISDNPAYPPMRVSGKDHDYIAVYGVPMGFTRMYKHDPSKLIHKGFGH